MWGAAINTDEALLAHPPLAHHLLCGLVSNRPWTGTGPWPKSWRPLHYNTDFYIFSAFCVCVCVCTFTSLSKILYRISYAVV